MRWLVALSLVLLIVGAVVKLSCVAGERRVEPAAHWSLFTEGVEAELPVSADIDPAASPALLP
jgi:hypothetical protein